MEDRCNAVEVDERGFSRKRAHHGILEVFNWVAKWVGCRVKLKHRVGETGCIWGSGSLRKLSGRSWGGGSVDGRGGTEGRCASR